MPAAVKGKAGVETLGVFGNSADDGMPGPVRRAADGAASSLTVFRQEFEVGAFRAQVRSRPAGDVPRLNPYTHANRMAAVLFGSPYALPPPHPGAGRSRTRGKVLHMKTRMAVMGHV